MKEKGKKNGGKGMEEEVEYELLKDKKLRKTKVSLAIIKHFKKIPDEIPKDFNWREFLVDGKSIIPQALDQGKEETCIVFALFALLSFQLELLKTKHKSLKGLKICMKFMLLMFTYMPKTTRTIHQYFDKLMNAHFSNTKESRKAGRGLTRVTIRKFSIAWAYSINIGKEGMVTEIQEVIRRFGGVLMGLNVYTINDQGDKVIMQLNPEKGDIRADKKAKKNKVSKEEIPEFKLLAHAVFCYGWKSEPNEDVVFLYLNSFGKKDGDQGHREIEDLKDINAVYAVQLDYNITGF